MNNILNFDDYLLESNSIYALKPEVKTKLLELDEKYHKLIEKFRTKYVATTCSNLKEEFDKFMSAKNMSQKYYPQLEIENSNVDNKLMENFEKQPTSDIKLEPFILFSAYYRNFHLSFTNIKQTDNRHTTDTKQPARRVAHLILRLPTFFS